MGRRFRRLRRLKREFIRITRRLFRVCFCCGIIKETFRVDVVPVAELTSDNIGAIIEDNSCRPKRGHGDQVLRDDDSLNLSDWESTGSVNSLFLSTSEILDMGRPTEFATQASHSDLTQEDVTLSELLGNSDELTDDVNSVPDFPTEPGSFSLTYSDWTIRCDNYPIGWNILHTISQGQFGKVQLAMLDETQKRFVVKTITATSSDEDTLLTYCQSPFVTKLHSVFSTESQRLLILPQYQFGDLGSLLEKDKSQRMADEKVAVWIACKLYAAIKFIHRERVFHLDITPTNILIDNNGFPILTNFGRARMCEDVSGKRSAPPDPCYTSPEILRNEQPDGMADLWSVACCLYQILLRSAPYPGRTADESLVSISRGLPRNLGNLSIKAMDFLAFELQSSRRQRLGYEGGVMSVVKHRLFNDIDWDLAFLGARTEESPLLEILESDDFQQENHQNTPCSEKRKEDHDIREGIGLSPVADYWSVLEDFYDNGGTGEI